VAWTPRRHRLGGVYHGVAVNDLLAALAAPPARRGGLRKRCAARRGAALRALDMQVQMGYAEDSGVSGRQGLGTVRWGKPGGGVFPVALRLRRVKLFVWLFHPP